MDIRPLDIPAGSALGQRVLSRRSAAERPSAPDGGIVSPTRPPPMTTSVHTTLVDHQRRVEFWIEDTTTDSLYLHPVTARTHLRELGVR